MFRRDSAGIAVSAAMENQQKGSTPSGIHFALYDKRSLLTTQPEEATERCQPSLKQDHAGLIMVHCCVCLLSFAIVIVCRKNKQSFPPFPLTHQPKCCQICMRVRKQRTEGPLEGPSWVRFYICKCGRKHPPG